MLACLFSKRLLSRSVLASPNIRLFSSMPHSSEVFDLTSDTATRPTDEMFDMMKSAHRGDDVFAVRLNNFCLLSKT
jgi:hypothetical protein